MTFKYKDLDISIKPNSVLKGVLMVLKRMVVHPSCFGSNFLAKNVLFLNCRKRQNRYDLLLKVDPTGHARQTKKHTHKKYTDICKKK